MLHIKDIEAFARINEALFRTPGTAERSEGDDADLSSHPAVLLARLMAAAQASAEETARAEAAQREPEGEAVENGAESVDAAAHDVDPAPAQPMTMAGLFSRMMFGQR